eukprot:XP_008660201.1 uncharacterized protein LOC103639200 isoform X1 [Zea mays]
MQGALKPTGITKSLSDSSSPPGSPAGTQGLRSAPRTSTAAPPISSTASGARRCPGDRPSRKSSAEKRKVSRLFQSTSMHPKPVPQKKLCRIERNFNLNQREYRYKDCLKSSRNDIEWNFKLNKRKHLYKDCLKSSRNDIERNFKLNKRKHLYKDCLKSSSLLITTAQKNLNPIGNGDALGEAGGHSGREAEADF